MLPTQTTGQQHTNMVTHYITLPSRHSQLGIEYLSCLRNVAGCSCAMNTIV